MVKKTEEDWQRRFEQETGKHAIWGGKKTKGYLRWCKKQVSEIEKPKIKGPKVKFVDKKGNNKSLIEIYNEGLKLLEKGELPQAYVMLSEAKCLYNDITKEEKKNLQIDVKDLEERIQQTGQPLHKEVLFNDLPILEQLN